jgi:hypothetical protein
LQTPQLTLTPANRSCGCSKKATGAETEVERRLVDKLTRRDR